MNESEFEDLIDNSEFVTAKDENGIEKEFNIIDGIEYKNNKYLLVIESKFMYDDEIEAIILKENKEDNDEIIYSILEDEDKEEFNTIVKLFQNSNEEYDIEI